METIYRGTENAGGARGCRLADGQLLVSFMRQTRMSSNDFRPTFILGSPDAKTWGPIYEPFQSETARYSIFGQVGKGAKPKEFLFYGSRCERLHQGESFWSEEHQAMLPTELVWARSRDEGKTWSELRVIPCSLPCAAEVTSPICVTRQGRWLACFSPHRRTVHRRDNPACLEQITLLLSDDEGESWRNSALIQLPPGVCGAEAWVVELADGRLLATGSQIDRNSEGGALPNIYALSTDNGDTWTEAEDALAGQSSATLPLADGSVLFAYSHRMALPYGIGVAHARPSKESFGILKNRIVWESERHNRKQNVTGEFRNWTSYTFGEPSLLEMQDGKVLLLFWQFCDPEGAIPFIRLDS